MSIMNDNENTISLFCEECGADFHVEHEMGLQYQVFYCPFCSEQLPEKEAHIEGEELLH